MEAPYFVAIDFDGTIADIDIIDAVLQRFAGPEWRSVEQQWDQGHIGSGTCLKTQMALVDQPIGTLLDYIDEFVIDETFKDFVLFLQERRIPFGIFSDGFQVFIERLLGNAGIGQVPVYANLLTETNGGLRTHFPYAREGCDAANCKCAAVEAQSGGQPLILIGDGRSDFCIAHKAFHVFTKNKLTGHCRRNDISHTPFDNFGEITAFLKTMSMAEVLPQRTLKERI